MNRRQLGALHGTLLLFGGPYSNLQATQALRDHARLLNIPAKNIICTGDIVAYCAQPNETIELLQDWGINIVMGNCEESLAWNAEDCGCGFEAGSTCEALSDSWFRFASQAVTQSHKQWMRALPRSIKFTYQGKQFAVIHGGVEQINQFVFASTDINKKLAQITAAEVDGVVAGHSGLPFSQQISDKLWHNPGVIGMPANDGTAHGWYSVWHPEQNKIRIEHCALNYNAELAQDYMYKANLENGYADALTSGLWPSMDILPVEERAQQDIPINGSVVVF